MNDDLISRQAMLDVIEELKKIHFDRVVVLNKVRDRVLDLPPVNPQEPKYCDRNICISNEYNGIGCDECEVTKSQELKTGHWIEKEDFNGDTYYDCSECGESFCLIDGTPTDNLYNYCPNCGCRMQESEDEE